MTTSPKRWPDGHFYSAIFDPDDARNSLMRMDPWFNPKGIRIDENDMVALFQELSVDIKRAPFPDTKQREYRYYFLNDFYSYGDASIYFSIICKLKPKRIIEIGSGFS